MDESKEHQSVKEKASSLKIDISLLGEEIQKKINKDIARHTTNGALDVDGLKQSLSQLSELALRDLPKINEEKDHIGVIIPMPTLFVFPIEKLHDHIRQTASEMSELP